MLKGSGRWYKGLPFYELSHKDRNKERKVPMELPPYEPYVKTSRYDRRCKQDHGKSSMIFSVTNVGYDPRLPLLAAVRANSRSEARARVKQYLGESRFPIGCDLVVRPDDYKNVVMLGVMEE